MNYKMKMFFQTPGMPTDGGATQKSSTAGNIKDKVQWRQLMSLQLFQEGLQKSEQSLLCDLQGGVNQKCVCRKRLSSGMLE